LRTNELARLRELQQQGPRRVRVGLLPEGKRPVREGCAVVDAEGRELGLVTSGAPSPTLGRPIAMAMIELTTVP
jgi:aminomethyltransferase